MLALITLLAVAVAAMASSWLFTTAKRRADERAKRVDEAITSALAALEYERATFDRAVTAVHGTTRYLEQVVEERLPQAVVRDPAFEVFRRMSRLKRSRSGLGLHVIVKSAPISHAVTTPELKDAWARIVPEESTEGGILAGRRHRHRWPSIHEAERIWESFRSFEPIATDWPEPIKVVQNVEDLDISSRQSPKTGP